MIGFKRGWAGIILTLTAVAVLGIFVISPSAPAARAEDAAARKRLPEPDAAAQAKAEKLVRELFKAGYAKRKSAERAALARDLMRQAEQTVDDPAGRFVLLREARDIAAAAGDVELSMSAADAMSEAYRVDPLAAKMAALAAVPLGDKKAASAAAAAYLAVSEDALAADEDLELAAKAAAQAVAAARKAGDQAAAARGREQVKAVAAARKDRAAADVAEKALAANPDDPRANLTLGRYLCFVKGDWEQGAPMLAKGSDPVLKELAGVEVKLPADAAAMASLGNAWWDLPDGQGGVTAAQARRRAAHWYEKALPNLTGLKKAAAQARVKQVTAAGGLPVAVKKYVAMPLPAQHLAELEDPTVPDEFQVEVDGRHVRVWGTKRADVTASSRGHVHHFGKAVIFEGLSGSGKLTVGVPVAGDHARYFLLLVSADGRSFPNTKGPELKKDVVYQWRLTRKGRQTALSLTADGKVIDFVAAKTAGLQGFGFAAIGRFPGDPVDMTVTVD